jgi:hypothetical protein
VGRMNDTLGPSPTVKDSRRFTPRPPPEPLGYLSGLLHSQASGLFTMRTDLARQKPLEDDLDTHPDLPSGNRANGGLFLAPVYFWSGQFFGRKS